MGDARLDGFDPRTVDKVERLLDLLEEFGEHPALAGKIAMHGGTAINLFMFDLPRLSVDIDISYVGAVGRDEMMAERPLVERAIQQAAKAQGYAVSPGEGGHAGRTFVLNYRSPWGPDHVKVDCIYMNRSPLVPPTPRESVMRPGLGVTMFSNEELAGGKVKAFFDRVKIRDLYDIGNLAHYAESLSCDDEARFHKTVLYYASMSAAFPHGFESRPERFEKLHKEYRDQLVPMLRKSSESDLDSLVSTARGFIEGFVLPRDNSEREYLDYFAAGDYRPELLFGQCETAERAAVNPEALWKLQNIRKMN